MTCRILTCMMLAGIQCVSTALPISIVDLSVPYQQNFDSLASSGLGHTALPLGWVIHESGNSADGKYTPSTGSSNTGDTYSFGAGGSTERALGGLRSSNLIPLFGAQFRNDTGQVMTGWSISYWGEQWRLGTTNRQDWLRFGYSLDATSLTNGTWVSVPALDFGSPSTSGPVGQKNGNDSAYRTYLSHTIDGLGIEPGQTWWIRWTDDDVFGADDGLAVDDLVISFRGFGGPAALPEGGSGTILLALAMIVLGRLRCALTQE